MHRCNDRRGKINGMVALYNEFKATFGKFCKEIGKALTADTLYNVGFKQASPVSLLLTFFDRVEMAVTFEPVLDDSGDLRARIVATVEEEVVKILYFDRGGRVTESVGQTMSNINMLSLPGINLLVLFFIDQLIERGMAFETVAE